MIAGLFCKACTEMAQIYRQLGDEEKAGTIISELEKMQQTIYNHGWDGEWFLRAYDAFGRKVGSKENNEGKIFIESQGWCIMGGVGLKNGYAEKALQSVNKHLATPDGIILQQPAFQSYHLHLGEISSYPPGYKENAGIFTHNNPWIQIAETMLGHGDQAFDYYMSTCPPNKEKNIETYRAEPYVYSQMTAGRDAPTPGEAKNSWLTGTAAWAFLTISQYILGIQPGYAGLKIDPCIPKTWQEFSIQRKFRDAIYKIHIKNPWGVNKGIREIMVDGKLIAGNVVPIFGDGRIHEVNVVMG